MRDLKWLDSLVSKSIDGDSRGVIDGDSRGVIDGDSRGVIEPLELAARL